MTRALASCALASALLAGSASAVDGTLPGDLARGLRLLGLKLPRRELYAALNDPCVGA